MWTSLMVWDYPEPHEEYKPKYLAELPEDDYIEEDEEED